MDPVSGGIGSIVNCNGKNACGDPNFMAAVCANESCSRPSVHSCTRTINFRENRGANFKHVSVLEVPFASWNHIIKQGYWCIPGCILDGNVHPKMALISDMPSLDAMCKQYAIHGRCGIDFNP